MWRPGCWSVSISAISFVSQPSIEKLLSRVWHEVPSSQEVRLIRTWFRCIWVVVLENPRESILYRPCLETGLDLASFSTQHCQFLSISQPPSHIVLIYAGPMIFSIVVISQCVICDSVVDSLDKEPAAAVSGPVEEQQEITWPSVHN